MTLDKRALDAYITREPDYDDRPMTLTEMLNEDMLDPYPKPDATDKVKEIFKEWLRTVGLTNYYSPNRDGFEFNTTESIRHLLIALVDEP